VFGEEEEDLVGLGLELERVIGREEKWHEEAERPGCSFYSSSTKTESGEVGGALMAAGEEVQAVGFI
jgi:hypothetical protein